MSEPFEPSPFMPGGTRVFEDDFNPVSIKQEVGEADADASHFLPVNEKENITRENNVAKIKVVVCRCFMHISNLYINKCQNTYFSCAVVVLLGF